MRLVNLGHRITINWANTRSSSNSFGQSPSAQQPHQHPPLVVLPAKENGEDIQARLRFIHGKIENRLVLRHLPQARHQVISIGSRRITGRKSAYQPPISRRLRASIPLVSARDSSIETNCPFARSLSNRRSADVSSKGKSGFGARGLREGFAHILTPIHQSSHQVPPPAFSAFAQSHWRGLLRCRRSAHG